MAVLRSREARPQTSAAAVPLLADQAKRVALGSPLGASGAAAIEAQSGPQLRLLLQQQLQLIPLEASADSLVPLEAPLGEVVEATLGEVWRLPLRQHLQAVSNREVEYAGVVPQVRTSSVSNLRGTGSMRTGGAYRDPPRADHPRRYCG